MIRKTGSGAIFFPKNKFCFDYRAKQEFFGTCYTKKSSSRHSEKQRISFKKTFLGFARNRKFSPQLHRLIFVPIEDNLVTHVLEIYGCLTETWHKFYIIFQKQKIVLKNFLLVFSHVF